ncbi:MAG: hypothetical protein HFG27_02450 [Provencibacterium sp.]|jgi:hypothetical protein|nr:hypothetical protein [Provencibacterium sp.]
MKKLLVPAAAGIIVGVITLIGQRYLPINLNFLANSGAVWLVPAFLLSFFFREDAKISITTAIICLLGCVSGYYVSEAIFNQHPLTFSKGILIWSIIALAAGAVFGIGANWANTKSNPLKYCGMNLLPAVFVAEGVDEILHISDYSHMIPAVVLKIAIGIALYIIINRRLSLKGISLACFIGFSVLGVVVYMVLGSRVLV